MIFVLLVLVTAAFPRWSIFSVFLFSLPEKNFAPLLRSINLSHHSQLLHEQLLHLSKDALPKFGDTLLIRYSANALRKNPKDYRSQVQQIIFLPQLRADNAEFAP